MSSIIGRAAFRASRPLRAQVTRPLRASGVNSGDAAEAIADNAASKNAMKKGAKKDPELYVRPPWALIPEPIPLPFPCYTDAHRDTLPYVHHCQNNQSINQSTHQPHITHYTPTPYTRTQHPVTERQNANPFFPPNRSSSQSCPAPLVS